MAHSIGRVTNVVYIDTIGLTLDLDVALTNEDHSFTVNTPVQVVLDADDQPADIRSKMAQAVVDVAQQQYGITVQPTELILPVFQKGA